MIIHYITIILFCSIIQSSFLISTYSYYISYTYSIICLVRIQLLGSREYTLAKSIKYSNHFLNAFLTWRNNSVQPTKFVSKDVLWSYTDPYPYLSVYNSEVTICHNNTFLLMMIPTRSSDYSIRNIFRKEYPQNTTILNRVINRVFVIAITTQNRQLLLSLKQEAIENKDIILINSPEDNIHLSKITWGGYYWITQYCNTANYIGKFDTDEIIILEKLVKKLLYLPTRKLYAGYVWKDVKTIAISKTNQRWVFPKDYPHVGYHHSYVSGVAELFSKDIIPLLAVGAYFQDLFMTAGEDFMVGIILSKLGIHPFHIDNGFVNLQRNFSRKVCNYCIWHTPILKKIDNLRDYMLLIKDCNYSLINKH